MEDFINLAEKNQSLWLEWFENIMTLRQPTLKACYDICESCSQSSVTLRNFSAHKNCMFSWNYVVTGLTRQFNSTERMVKVVFWLRLFFCWEARPTFERVSVVLGQFQRSDLCEDDFSCLDKVWTDSGIADSPRTFLQTTKAFWYFHYLWGIS